MAKGNHRSEKSPSTAPYLGKSPTGIQGLDDITGGGFPLGRTTLLSGGPGCGKTLMATEYLVRGITQYDEPGVFVAFEETENELAENLASLGFDLPKLIEEQRLLIDHVELPPGTFAEVGEYDLEGLFVRLEHAIKSIGAKRIVLDTLETLFAGIPNLTLLRSELRRLFHWLKAKGVTAVITAEMGQGSLTRHGLEEYVSDCVIFLDHRVEGGISTRRLRIVKYRGSFHGTNEYPFLIDEQGISVVPITAVGLSHEVSRQRISTGIAGLDEMLGGCGYYRGSSALISGIAGTGKTTLSAHFASETCSRGEKVVYFGFEESFSQFARNMESVGLDFQMLSKSGHFFYEAARPTLQGLEAHLISMYRLIDHIRPCAVVVDPVSTFLGSGSSHDIKSMLMRLIDHLKARGITACFTSLMHDERQLETTDVGVSSLMDTWLLLRAFESNGERNRGLHVLKSRGMAHSNQVREFRMGSDGVKLFDVYVGPHGVLTGSARVLQEKMDKERALELAMESERRKKVLERRRKAIDAQILALEAEFEAEMEESLNRERIEREAFEQSRDIRDETGRMRTSSEQSPSRSEAH